MTHINVLTFIGKNLKDTVNKINKFAEENNIIINEDDKIRLVDYMLYLYNGEFKDKDCSETDFSKIIFFLGYNHPDKYPTRPISLKSFSREYNIDYNTLTYHVKIKIIKNSPKFFELKINQEETFYLKANDPILEFMRTVINKHLEKLVVLGVSLYTSEIEEDIVKELCYKKVFHDDFLTNDKLKGCLRGLIRRYINNYLNYDIKDIYRDNKVKFLDYTQCVGKNKFIKKKNKEKKIIEDITEWTTDTAENNSLITEALKCMNSSRYDEAIELLKAALSIDLDNEKILSYISYIYWLKKDYKNMFMFKIKQLRKNPDYANNLRNLFKKMFFKLRTYKNLDINPNSSMVVTPDEKYVIRGSNKNSVNIYDVYSGKLVKTFVRHEDVVNAVAISSDGKYLASGSDDKSVKLWELKTGTIIWTLKGHEDVVNTVAISPDGKYLASGSNDKSVKVWELETGTIIWNLKGHKDIVKTVSFSPNGEYLVSGSEDMSIIVWELRKKASFQRFVGHEYSVNSVDISPDGNFVISGSSDKSIRIWDLLTGKLIRKIETNGKVYSAKFLPSSNLIVACVSFGSNVHPSFIKIWDFQTGTLMGTFTGEQNFWDSVNSISISPKGSFIISGSHENTINVWVSFKHCYKFTHFA